MAQVKVTVIRPSVSVQWYIPPFSEKDYVKQTYSNMSNDLIVSEDSLITTRIKTGSLEDCQRFIAELNDASSILNERRVHNVSNGITYSIELIEDTPV